MKPSRRAVIGGSVAVATLSRSALANLFRSGGLAAPVIPHGGAFVTNAPTGTPSGLSEWGGPTTAGAEVTVGSSNLSVTALGRWDVAGNTQNHALAIFDATQKLQVGSSINVTLTGSGDYVYATVSPPIILVAQRSYYILSSENGLGSNDTLYHPGVSYSTTTDAILTGGILQAYPLPNSSWYFYSGSTQFC